MSNTPGTYAQFGEKAGSIMWSMHKRITKLEKERDKLQEDIMDAYVAGWSDVGHFDSWQEGWADYDYE